MIVTKTKAQMHAQQMYDQSISSILAARLILIKTATLIGAGSCLFFERLLHLEATLWIFLVPLALGILPLLAHTKVTGNKTYLWRM
jgi:hypothetical protein